MIYKYLTLLTPYITIFAGFYLAYLTYKNQLKLKAFELFLNRRDEVLKDIDKYINNLQEIMIEFDSENGEKVNWNHYSREYFHEGLILFHKMKGANFGKTAELLITSFYSIVNEALVKREEMQNEEVVRDWIGRTINTLAPLYGFAHSKMNHEIENITYPIHKKIYRKFTVIKKLLKQGNH